MWPWEHAIVGYLVYSLLCHAVYRDSPGGLEAFAVVFASVLPDLIDKPLAWQFGVFDAGYAVGHSIFFAITLSTVVGVVARSANRPRSALAFSLGYLVHLPGDVVDSYVREDVFLPELVLWPIVTLDAGDANTGFLANFLYYFGRYRSELLAGDLPTYVWLQLGLTGFAALLWLYDGAPVLRDLLRGCKRLVEKALGADRSFEDSPRRR
ncbi:metal-dependent hydrolase [Haloterrigena alkaliphila]|uniref:Metal-dependent hydrolase n=1 Tax=Haloterrigena alkaliphila TaxID=2816475 RepID=A0A8A2VAA3_9EURY|nr:metal-dependent hydrolase [Haloterrigena alkaliphila]QSW98883.1 metal-dependent hydrolase [Haloterrigena alkaliphila]